MNKTSTNKFKIFIVEHLIKHSVNQKALENRNYTDSLKKDIENINLIQELIYE